MPAPLLRRRPRPVVNSRRDSGEDSADCWTSELLFKCPSTNIYTLGHDRRTKPRWNARQTFRCATSGRTTSKGTTTPAHGVGLSLLGTCLAAIGNPRGRPINEGIGSGKGLGTGEDLGRGSAEGLGRCYSCSTRCNGARGNGCGSICRTGCGNGAHGRPFAGGRMVRPEGNSRIWWEC
jgi:hypothetical protein